LIDRDLAARVTEIYTHRSPPIPKMWFPSPPAVPVQFMPCWVALQYAELPSLSDRRDKLCRDFFPQIA